MSIEIKIINGTWEILKRDNGEYMITDTASYVTIHTKELIFSSDKTKDVYLSFFSDDIYYGSIWIENEGDRLAIEALIQQEVKE